MIDFPRIPGEGGNLTFVEGAHVPFEVRRVYWIYDVPGGAVRGGCASRTLQEVFIALSGSFEVATDDGHGTKKRFAVDRPDVGLHVPQMTWRRLENFSPEAVGLILASAHHHEHDCLRDHDDFLQLNAGAAR